MTYTLEERISIARTAAKYCNAARLLDDAEINSLVYLSAWQSLSRNPPEGFAEKAWIRLMTRRILIDEVRIRFGRDGQKRKFIATLELFSWGGEEEEDEQPIHLLELIQELSDGNKRTEYILMKMYEGHTKESIAKALNIHPSRISQILAGIRWKHWRLNVES